MANPSPNPDQAEFYAAPMIVQLREFLSQHRRALAHCLEGVTETEARVRLVPSKTTLLGLVKHATFVEQVWFQEARTGTPRAELGIAGTPDASFDLAETDTIESVLRGYGKAIKASDQALDGAQLGDVWSGNRRGDLTVSWILLHVLRELAQHLGHSEILREQILSFRADKPH